MTIRRCQSRSSRPNSWRMMMMMMMMSLYSHGATCRNRYKNINKSNRFPETEGTCSSPKTTKHVQKRPLLSVSYWSDSSRLPNCTRNNLVDNSGIFLRWHEKFPSSLVRKFDCQFQLLHSTQRDLLQGLGSVGPHCSCSPSNRSFAPSGLADRNMWIASGN